MYNANVVLAGATAQPDYQSLYLANNSALAANALSWNSPLVVTGLPTGKKWVVSSWVKSYGGSPYYELPEIRVWMKKKIGTYWDSDGSDAASRIGAANLWMGWARTHTHPDWNGYVDGTWVRANLYIDLSSTDYIEDGGNQGTEDEIYTYWSNNFTDGYTGVGTEFLHGNATVNNSNDSWANLYVVPNPSLSIPHTISNNAVNTAITLWDSDLSNYDFTDRAAWATYDTTSQNLYQFATQVAMKTTAPEARWPRPNGTPFDPTMSDQLNSAYAGAGNTARAEIITDAIEFPLQGRTGATANSYVSGRALHIRNSNVVMGDGTSHMPENFYVALANGTPGQENAWNSPSIISLANNRTWILSFYAKSYEYDNDAYKEIPNVYPWLRKKLDDDGSANTWYSYVGSERSGVDDNNAFELNNLHGAAGTPGEGEWRRYYEVIDLTSANVMYGRGGTSDLIHEGTESVKANFDADANGWITSGANTHWEEDAVSSSSNGLYITAVAPNLIANNYSIFELDHPKGFPIYPAQNGIIGVGATGNVTFHMNENLGGPNGGEIVIKNEGGITFAGPDGVAQTIPTMDTDIWTRWESGSDDWQAGPIPAGNTSYIMYTSMNAVARFAGADTHGSWFNTDSGGDQRANTNFVNVIWSDENQSWYFYQNLPADNPAEIPFIPDPANGDFLVAQILKSSDTDGSGIDKIESFVVQDLTQSSNAFSVLPYSGNTFVIQTGNTGTALDNIPAGKFPIAGANGEPGVTNSANTELSIDTGHYMANSSGLVGPANGAGASIRYYLPSLELSGSVGIGYNQFLFCNVASVQGSGTGMTNAAGISVSTFENFGITIPAGKKWVVSAYVKTNQAPDGMLVSLVAYTSDLSTEPTDGGPDWTYDTQLINHDPSMRGNVDGETGDWVRISSVLDLTSSDHTSVILGGRGYRAHRGSSGAWVPSVNDRIVWFSGFQLEEAPDATNQAGVYHGNAPAANTPFRLNTDLQHPVHSNTFPTPISGRNNNLIRVQIRANTMSATANFPGPLSTGVCILWRRRLGYGL